jgi:hypothetical protein
MFSFTRLGGADPILGVEMASTGEVACFGVDVHEVKLVYLHMNTHTCIHKFFDFVALCCVFGQFLTTILLSLFTLHLSLLAPLLPIHFLFVTPRSSPFLHYRSSTSHFSLLALRSSLHPANSQSHSLSFNFTHSHSHPLTHSLAPHINTQAFLKSLVSTGFKLPQKAIGITIPSDLLEDVVHHVWELQAMGYELFATTESYAFLQSKGIDCKMMYYADDKRQPNVRSLISERKIDLMVNLPTSSSVDPQQNFLTRRTAVDFGVPLINNPQIFKMFADSLKKHKEGKFTFSTASSLFDYYEREKEADAWTSPTEFH